MIIAVRIWTMGYIGGVPTSVKSPPPSSPEDFFAGVDEMRAYLDRHQQDPAHRHVRLAGVARDLLRPHRSTRLWPWLLQELGDALGASSGAVLTPGDAGWHSVHVIGGPTPLPSSRVFSTLLRDGAPDASAAIVQVVAGEGAVLPARGSDGVLAVIWLAGIVAIDAETCALLQAILDTAATVSETRASLGT